MWPREQHLRKIPTGLHSALQARNRTGDKNRMGPVVGCDWGIKGKHCPFANCCSSCIQKWRNHEYEIDIEGKSSGLIQSCIPGAGALACVENTVYLPGVTQECMTLAQKYFDHICIFWNPWIGQHTLHGSQVSQHVYLPMVVYSSVTKLATSMHKQSLTASGIDIMSTSYGWQCI